MASVWLYLSFVLFLGYFEGSNCQPLDSFADSEIFQNWEKFKVEHKKEYVSSEDESARFSEFLKNWNHVKAHNERFEKGETSYELGLNFFSDWFEDEINFYLNGLNLSSDTLETNESDLFVQSNEEVPASLDWREKGAVTPVKDQYYNKCGSCYAFSATGAIEGQHFLKHGKLVSLSEQNIVDCSRHYNNNGCKGGAPWRAFEYVKVNGGIDTEQSYPYEAKNGHCRFSRSNVGAKVREHKFLKFGDEKNLKKAVATVGPISVGIDGSTRNFLHYKKGVFYDPKCSSKHLTHAVLVVGYGKENGEDYWLVKNSYGRKWGDDGYIKMARNHNNNCGIATIPSFPLV